MRSRCSLRRILFSGKVIRIPTVGMKKLNAERRPSRGTGRATLGRQIRVTYSCRPLANASTSFWACALSSAYLV